MRLIETYMFKFIKNKSYFLVPLFFLTITIIFFRTVIFSKGIIVSHDWMLPYNSHQMEQYLSRPLYTWTYDMNLFGVKNPFFIQLPFMVLVKLFLILGLSGELLSKVLILLVFTFSGTSMYLLLRYLGLKNVSSLLGGFILITMPVFFDYAIMGWCFVLFSIGVILPIAIITFMKSIEENKPYYSVITGLLFAIAVLQSQSLVWFPMIFFAFSLSLIKDKTTLVSYIKSITIIILIALLLHISWWPNLIINKDPGIISSDLALDSVSVGMRMRLNFVNILRGWGGLFNYQYEFSYPKTLTPLSFLIPLMAWLSVVIKIKKKRDIRPSLIVIFSYMFILFLINPILMSKIPLSNILRDTGRFTVMTSFSLTILASIFFNYLITSNEKKYKRLALILVALIVLNALPFYTGQLYGEPHDIPDVRLRNYVFPEDYAAAENFLYTKKNFSKIYFPPSGTNISVKDQPKFNADYREIKDPFRGYSPFPGSIYMYYSSLGRPPQMSLLLDSIFDKNIDKESYTLLGLMNIKNIVVRNDIDYPVSQEKTMKELISISRKNLEYFGKVGFVNNEQYIPQFYIPNGIVYSPNDASILPAAISFNPDINRLGIYTEIENNILKDTPTGLIDTPQTVNQVLIEGRAVTISGENETTNETTKGYYFFVPKSGEYQIYTNLGSNIFLSKQKNIKVIKSGILGNKRYESLPIIEEYKKITENNKYIEWGKIYLKVGQQILFIPIDKTTKPPTNILLSAVSSQEVKEKVVLPKISFTRINPTKYYVSIRDAKTSFPLIFSESFHEGWKVFLNEKSSKKDQSIEGVTTYFDGDIQEKPYQTTFINSDTFETWGRSPIANNSHFQVNGYANSWQINPADIGGNENFDLIIEFQPQKNFYLGLFMSTIVFISCLCYLAYILIENFKAKNQK